MITPGKAALAREHLTAWASLIHPTYETPTHIQRLCAALEAVERGDVKRLMINMPPRHGKSITASVAFPSWYLGRHPDQEVMIASYGATLSEGFSRSARDALETYGPQVFGVKVAPDSRAVDSWNIGGRPGKFHAVGVGGALTGKGGSVLLLDDPVKDSEEASSEIIREKLWAWYQTTFFTRRSIAPEGAIVLIMTRWHEDDLAGRLLAEEQRGGDRWEKLIMPMVDDTVEPVQSGPILWPERVTRKFCDDLRRSSHTWEALYQQRPSNPGGNIFKKGWFRYYINRPWMGPQGLTPGWFDEIIISVDAAFKDLDSSDLVAIHVWGRRGPDRYFLDRVSDRMGFYRTVSEVLAMRKKWPLARRVYIEDKANGSAVIEVARKRITGVLAVKPQGGKLARAYAVQPQVEGQNVYLPDPAICTWTNEVIGQFASFPFAPHDDDVDAMTQALLKMESAGGYWSGLEERPGNSSGSGDGWNRPNHDTDYGPDGSWLRRI